MPLLTNKDGPAPNGKNGLNGHDAQTSKDMPKVSVDHVEEDAPDVRPQPASDGASTRDKNEGSSTSGKDGRFPRISRPVELMRSSYDVVVIGSGYGGGVAASRMARGRQSVCVLERGKERWPGEFPESTVDTLKELHVSGELAPGDRRGIPGKMTDKGKPNGLYQFVVGEGQNVFHANGLGGTSLLNANVFLESHPDVLNMEIWPEELRGKGSWEKYYERARQVLEPVEYPVNFPELAKANLLKRQAELMGWGDKYYRVPQTTRFEDGPNSTGVYMRASKLTGMDATGINDGSKSTTLVNYMSDAWNWGAEIFCECDIRYVTKAPEERGGYIVYFAWRSYNREKFSTFFDDLMWVHAKKLVFFGAGSIGTTEILLRSKQMGLEISDDLGTEMSGNGDMLGFSYNTDFDANTIATPSPSPERPVGPCITSVLDLRDQENPLDGFVVEDCAIPQALAPILFSMMEHMPTSRFSTESMVEKIVKAPSRIGGKLLGPYLADGSIQKTAAYLIMSHDSSQGRLELKNDRPILRYSGVGQSKAVSRVHEILNEMTKSVGGKFVENPAWLLLGKQEITVHPIGGARISRDNTGHNGVVDHMGKIFKGNSAKTHDGLVVCDASALPAAVGVNPFATITAFAERSVELVAQSHGISIDLETKNGLLDMFGKPAHPFPKSQDMIDLEDKIAQATETETAGIAFSEVMSGFIYAGSDVGEFEVAAKRARGRCESARFLLSTRSWNTNELINGGGHSANLTGTFSFGGIQFMVLRGAFGLFIKDTNQPETANLTYDFDMISPAGRVLHFNGFKVVNSAAYLSPLETWRQTTTLYVTITDMAQEVVGRGTLHIQPSDFSQELQTFEPTGKNILSQLGSGLGFLGYFTKALSAAFFSPLGKLQWPATGVNVSRRQINYSSSIQVTASDGIQSTLLMWNPIRDGNEVVGTAPTILFIPGAAVDHTIFALPTIKKNAVEYFREAGYRVYCITHRIGRTPLAKRGYTPYDTRRDIHAALVHIRKAMTASDPDSDGKTYVIAHCAGSAALACGLLDGSIPGHLISGITASQVFMTPKFGKVNSLLSRVPTAMFESVVGSYWDCSSGQQDSLVQKFMNQALRFYPSGEAESCKSAVCHRSQLAFGRLWTHANMNEETHSQLERFLGGISMTALDWLMKTGSVGSVTTNGPAYTELVTQENLKHLKGIPILFISGSANVVFVPENTDTSYTTLCSAHGREMYQREVFQGRGHLDHWMGSTSYSDVYPRVRRHVDMVMQVDRA